LPAGRSYTITEIDNTAQFDFVSDPSGECVNVQVIADRSHVCRLTNSLTTAAQAGAVVLPQSSLTGAQTSQEGVINRQVVSPQAGISTGAGLTEGIINPPFDVCKSNVLKSNNVNAQRPGGTLGNDEVLIRQPSSATYTIGGNIPIDNIKDALERYGTKRITIQLYTDLDPNDQLTLALSDPQFRGRIIAEDKDGIPHKILDFNVFTVRTECKYITIAHPFGNAPNLNVAPLGQIGEAKNGGTVASAVNKLLVATADKLATVNTSPNPAQLNSPFAVCDVPATRTVAQGQVNSVRLEDDDLAIYSIRGEVRDLKELHGGQLNVEITVDLNPRPDDLAKIVRNNNPYVIANLIADEDKKSAHKISFVLHDLWTDCKDIALNNQPIFKPIITETNP
jgi:hypothetical protein